MKELHSDLSLEAVAATIPWREKYRAAASPGGLIAVFDVIERRVSVMEGLDLPGYVKRIGTLLKACDGLLNFIEPAGADAGGKAEGDPAGSQIGEVVDIGSLTEQLRDQLRPMVDRSHFLLDPRIDHLKRTFIWQAALAWEVLTGTWPSSSRKGPFVDFCTCAWLECGMPDLGEDEQDVLGPKIERALSRETLSQIADL